MKLDRLSSNASYRARKTGMAARVTAEERFWRIGQVELIDADREQSLREQLHEVEASELPRPADGKSAARITSDLAMDIVRLGPYAQQLVKADTPILPYRPIDEKA